MTFPEEAKYHDTDSWETLEAAVKNVSEKVDSYITGSPKVNIRVADARRLVCCAKYLIELKRQYEIRN